MNTEANCYNCMDDGNPCDVCHNAQVSASPSLAGYVPDFKGFANSMIQIAWDGGLLDGADIQELAEKHGLLKGKEVTEPCGEGCVCEEYGFPTTCYCKTY